MSKKNKQNGVTRQGVRDLSNIGSRVSRGKKVELPPEEAFLGPGFNDHHEQETALKEMRENRRFVRQNRG